RFVTREQNLKNSTAVLSSFHWRLIVLYTLYEVIQLLWESVIPGLLVHRESPARRGRRLFYRISIASLAERNERATLKHIGIDDSLAAVELRGIIHSALFGPAIFDQRRRSSFKFDDQDRIVVASGPRLMHVGAGLSVYGLNSRFAQHPSGELDSVTSHVEQHAASGPLYIPEPIRMRARMLFALLDQINLTDRPLIYERLGPDILGGETQFLGIHQLDLGIAAGRYH